MAFKTDLAYFAGIIDGEGSISLTKHKSPKCWRGWIINPRLIIANSSIELINYSKKLLNNLGIAYSIYVDKRVNLKAKDSFKLNIARQHNVHKLLKLILPMLIIKKKQAELLIEWIDIQSKRFNSMHIRDPQNRRFTGANKWDYTDEQYKIFNEIRRLNHRGI